MMKTVICYGSWSGEMVRLDLKAEERCCLFLILTRRSKKPAVLYTGVDISHEKEGE
jgi:hypothetical protein